MAVSVTVAAGWTLIHTAGSSGAVGVVNTSVWPARIQIASSQPANDNASDPIGAGCTVDRTLVSGDKIWARALQGPAEFNIGPAIGGAVPVGTVVMKGPGTRAPAHFLASAQHRTAGRIVLARPAP